MNKWYQIREQSAGKIRLELLWVVYKIFGIRFLKFILWFVCLFIVPFAKPARIASKKYMQILNKYLTQHNFKKIKISTPILGIYLDKTIIQKDTCTLVFIATLFTTSNQQQMFIDKWIKKIWYIYIQRHATQP